MDRAKFDFEKLQVWSEAVEFADVVLSIGDTLRDEKLSYRLAEQLSAAATSISMNIAEGRGRSSRKSYVLYLEYSRRSLYEVVTLTFILFRRGWVPEEIYLRIIEKALRIVKMINALISAIKRNMS